MHWYQELLWRWPDLVITGLGVLLGAFFAFAIERKRTHHEQAIAERLDRERLEAHMERVKIEVRDNKQYVDKMIGDVLDKAPQANSPARIEFLKWAATLADALSLEAYEDLAASGLRGKLPIDQQRALFEARQMVLGLKNMIKSGVPAVEFYEHYGPGGEGNKKAENIRKYAYTVLESLEEVLRDVWGAEAASGRGDGLTPTT